EFLLERGRHLVDRLRNDRVEYGRRPRNRLRRTRRTELELVARECKWRRAVAIARVRVQPRQRARAQPEQARLLAALRTARLLDLREDVLELVAQEYRDDRGWSLVRTQPVIIAGICDRSPHQVLVTVHRSQYRRAEEQELHVLMRILARLE